jgi:hypothetical protein
VRFTDIERLESNLLPGCCDGSSSLAPVMVETVRAAFPRPGEAGGRRRSERAGVPPWSYSKRARTSGRIGALRRRSLREQGATTARLFTGTANPHRSYDLYESVGFRRKNEYVRYREPLA